MAELHESLKFLGPTAWSSVPEQGQPLDTYLNDLFLHTQTILDSVPVPAPDDASQPSKAQSRGQATKSSEVTLSSERSAPPPFGHEKLQKEWGKPMKIKASENPLGLSVYKLSGKDSKGSWFARHSIHEGVGYSKFKRSLQLEFEKSLAEIGPPGTGNVRGIGGEERVEQIKTDKGTVEVYRLSAQFPGPTAARDFVTMLVTSDSAMQVDKTKQNGKSEAPPRHYMIISKPCDHPKTQPRNGFVRGYYESVEFIREVPRKLKTSQSATNLDAKAHDHHHTKKDDSGLPYPDESGARKRSATTGTPSPTVTSRYPDPTDPEDNPVEWMMITRSDPGGGIPRFLVERGTPSSICADAVKFMDWACQNEDEPTDAQSPDLPTSGTERRPSHQSWRSRSLIGIEEQNDGATSEDVVQPTEGSETIPRSETIAGSDVAPSTQQPPASHGLFNTAADALRPYAPQMILNRLPGGGTTHEQSVDPAQGIQHNETTLSTKKPDDAVSIKSTTSFASAEDHWSSEAEVESVSSTAQSPTMTAGSKEHIQHENELQRLDSRKEALHKKFAEAQAKHNEEQARQMEQTEGQTAKTKERHERAMKKHEEKYQKEMAKIERKQEKEKQKMEAKKKKQADKDDKFRLTRERDEAREELQLAKRESESLRQIVADLQRQNTALVIKLGKAGVLPYEEGEEKSRSRASSLSRKEKNKKVDLAAASAAASMKKHDHHG